MNARLPADLQANDIPGAPDPFDHGLDLAAWDRYDPDGYAAAAMECVDGDDLRNLYLTALAGETAVVPKVALERMNERLRREVEDGAMWVARWWADRTDE